MDIMAKVKKDGVIFKVSLTVQVNDYSKSYELSEVLNPENFDSSKHVNERLRELANRAAHAVVAFYNAVVATDNANSYIAN